MTDTQPETSRSTAEGVCAEGDLIGVPVEAFALLFAWSYTEARQVPQHIKAHPAWPAHRDDRSGHLSKVLRPYALKAMEQLKNRPDISKATDPSNVGEV